MLLSTFNYLLAKYEVVWKKDISLPFSVNIALFFAVLKSKGSLYRLPI
ncbi:MAG: hypothetical protein ACI8PB_001358 [Desulforhopalus sp.]|jgi:hypothetical protein